MTAEQFQRYKEHLLDQGWRAKNAKQLRFDQNRLLIDLFDYPGTPRTRRLRYREDVEDWCFYEVESVMKDPLPKDHLTGFDALAAFEDALEYSFSSDMDLELLLS